VKEYSNKVKETRLMNNAFHGLGAVAKRIQRSLLRGATLSWDQIPAMDYQKCYRDVLITARGNLYEKILAAPSVGRTMDISAMYGAQSKKK
jgi:hypothetical protein